MSETVHYIGRLKEIPSHDGETVQDVAKRLLCDRALTKLDMYDHAVECLLDQHHREYVVHNDKIYEVHIDEQDPDPNDIFNAINSQNSTINFVVRYYNGGCGFNEAIGYALDNLKREDKKTKIKFVDADDWIGIYVNDKLVYEGHHVYPTQLLDILKEHANAGLDYKAIECDDDWLAERGSLPLNFNEVKRNED